MLEQIFYSNLQLPLNSGFLNDLRTDVDSVLEEMIKLGDAFPEKYKSQATLASAPLIVFHCEFSIERGPRMFNYMRRLDRELNEKNYPLLNYPEIYVLSEGYSQFVKEYGVISSLLTLKFIACSRIYVLRRTVMFRC